MKVFIKLKSGIFQKEGKFINRNGKRYFRDHMGQEYPEKIVKIELSSKEYEIFEKSEIENSIDLIKTNILIHPEDEEFLKNELKNFKEKSIKRT